MAAAQGRCLPTRLLLPRKQAVSLQRTCADSLAYRCCTAPCFSTDLPTSTLTRSHTPASACTQAGQAAHSVAGTGRCWWQAWLLQAADRARRRGLWPAPASPARTRCAQPGPATPSRPPAGRTCCTQSRTTQNSTWSLWLRSRSKASQKSCSTSPPAPRARVPATASDATAAPLRVYRHSGVEPRKAAPEGICGAGGEAGCTGGARAGGRRDAGGRGPEKASRRGPQARRDPRPVIRH